MNKKSLLIVSLAFLILSGPAKADLFGGPDNFDECVADKMKGQIASMIYTVRRACERKFETELQADQRKLIDIGWSDSTKSNVSVFVEENDSDFVVTRVLLTFSKAECGQAKSEEFDVKVEADFSGWVPGSDPKITTKASVDNATSLKCMRTKSVFGKRVQ